MWLQGVGKEVGGLLVHERRDAVYALAPVGEAAKECLHLIGIEDAGLDPCDAVSYTHLTLPTSDLV